MDAHPRSRSRGRGGLVVLVLCAGLLLAPAGAAHAAKGPGNAKVPPDVIARVAVLQRLFVGGFGIDPGSGGIGTVITFTGTCGFAAEHVSLSLEIETEPGSNNIVAIDLFLPIPWSAFGAFSLPLTVPPTRLDGEPVQPGTYRARAACDLLESTSRELASQPFVVVAT